MRNFTMYCVALMLVVSWSSCTRTGEVDHAKIVKPADPAAYLVPIYDATAIHRPYKVIGTAIASTGQYDNILDAVDHLQDEAREVGGDALINLYQEQQKCSEIPPGGKLVFSSSEEIFSAKIIVWSNNAHSLINGNDVAMSTISWIASSAGYSNPHNSEARLVQPEAFLTREAIRT